MTARILRIELRRSTAPWVAVLVVALGAALFYLTTSRDGWWIALAVQERSMLLLLWPLALGAGAWQGRRERRERMEELISSTPLPRWRRVLPTAVAMAIGAVAGYLGTFGAGTGRTLPYATYFSIGTVPVVAVGAVSMITAVWLGLAVGSRYPSTLTPTLLGVAAVAVQVGVRGVAGAGDMSRVGLLLPTMFGGPADSSMEFAIPTARTNLSQAVWLAAIAATGLLLFAAASRRGRLAAILPAVIGAAVVLPLQPGNADAYEPDRDAIARVCTPDTPLVCVPRAHQSALNSLRDPARQALAMLAAKLPNAPTSVAEEYRQPHRSERQTVLVQPLRVSAGQFTDPPEDILWYLLDGAGTRLCDALDLVAEEQLDRYLTARQVAAAWLLGHLPANPPGPAPLSPATEPALRTLRGLPAGEQRARVAALREAELTCQPGDRLEILTGPNGPR
jgi:hypothetical protein